jgi:hypothetical protein
MAKVMLKQNSVRIVSLLRALIFIKINILRRNNYMWRDIKISVTVLFTFIYFY